MLVVKSPAFAIVAVLTLALGIGANSAIFSVVDTVLLRPLPFKDPDKIVMIWGRYANDNGPVRGNVHSFPDYVDLRDQGQTFSAMAAYTQTSGILSLDDDAQALEGVAATPEIFNVLAINPLLGRGFTWEDAKNEADRVVVLTHPLWKTAFGGDRRIIGRQVMISARSHIVIGVMPPGWKFPIEAEHIDYILPLHYLGVQTLSDRGSHFLSVVGRLKPAVSLKQAEAEESAIAARLSRQYPNTNRELTAVAAVSLRSDVVGEVRPALLIMLGAVALVLLIACANVANLLLARAALRSREIAIRTALGASRIRIIRQLLCESLLLALLGGTAGLLLACWGVDVLRALGRQGLPHVAEIEVSSAVGFSTFALAIGSTLVFGLIPALQVSRPSIHESLQQGTKGSTGGLQTNRLRAVLVVSQVSVSLLLLAGAGLLIKSFLNLRATDLGFDPVRLMTIQINLPRVRYPNLDQQIRTCDAIMEKLGVIPGIDSASCVSPLPLGGNIRSHSFTVSGAAPLQRGQHPDAGYLVVKSGYFHTLKIPVLQGRSFNRADGLDSPLVVMINEAFARKHFPDENPLGQQIIIDRPGNQAPACTVVGVVGNSRHDTLAAPPRPEMYVPFPQDPSRSIDIVLRVASMNLAGLDTAVKSAVHSVDQDLFVPKIEPMTTFIAMQLARPRFSMVLLAIFAGAAVALAAIGVYGVVSYSVTRRTREFGIRIALGAQRTQMLGMVLRQSLTLVFIGITIGILIALAATRLIATLLYGVGVNDFSIYATVIVLLSAVAFLASYIPARRALKIDPIVALRHE